MIIKHGRHIYCEIHEVRKGMWAFIFLDCAFWALIGWAEKLQSHSYVQEFPQDFCRICEGKWRKVGDTL